MTDAAGPSIPIPDYPLDLVNRPGLFVNVSSDGTTLYLTGEPNVTAYDVVSGTFGTPAYNTPNPRASLLSVDGAHLLTANGWTWGLTGFDTSTLTTVFEYTGLERTPVYRHALALTPNGATAYVGTLDGVVPIHLPNGYLWPKLPQDGRAGPVAITPDGGTLIHGGGGVHGGLPTLDVRLWYTANDTERAIIPVGGDPYAIAVTPDQAPIARLSVTPAEPGSPTTFDASASTVEFGSIVSYEWDFGDGTTAWTPTPITTHTYAGGSYTASVTTRSSLGTSTERVFTGQTMMRNGGPQARATAQVGSGVQLGAPVVSMVFPSAGLVAGGDSVNILGSGFTGATAVSFGGIPAASFIVNGDNSITATTPAAPAAGAIGVSVTNGSGTSAITEAGRFTYLAAIPPVTTPCPPGGCVAVFPTAGGFSMSASAATGCNTCNVVGAIEPLGGTSPKCPGGAAPQLQPAGWVQAQQNGGAFSAISAGVSFAMTSAEARETRDAAWFKLVSVCYVNGVPTRVSARGASAQSATAATAAAKVPRAITLKDCSRTKNKPPCLAAKAVTDGVAHVDLQIPGEGGTFLVVTREVKVGRVKPARAARGALLTIPGRNMDAATGVLIGGVEAPIIARTRGKLEVTVPEGAASGDVTVLTLSRAVAAPKPLILLP